MMTLPHIVIWLISGAMISCILIRPGGLAEAWWAAGGAAVLILTTLIPPAQAGGAVLKGVDVYLFLTGMMLLSELAREKGVFDWIAEVAAGHAAGSPRRLFFLIYLAGTVVTAFLSNDATAVVLTPAVLAIVRRLKVEAAPHLLACAFIANAASFLLPISNPANLVVFGQHMPPLLKWLGTFLLPSLISVSITFIGLRWMSRHDLRGKIKETLTQTKLSREGRFALAGLIFAAGALIAASAVGWSLGAPTCAAALLAVLMVAFYDKRVPLKVVKSVSWSVIPLVAGLFVMVEALQATGLLGLAVTGLQSAAHLGRVGGNVATAFAVGLISNLMNNLPVGLIGGAVIHSSHPPGSLANAILIGVDLGPNLSVAGSLATILWLIALRRENVHITGWQFFKVGLVVMPLSLLGSVLLLAK